MIAEGEAVIQLETTRRAFRNQEKSKQRSAIVIAEFWEFMTPLPFIDKFTKLTYV